MIALAVRHSVRSRLSYADVVAWFAERGLVLERSTIYRWVQRFLPLFAQAARAYRRPVGTKWRVDETYVRLHGRWTYIERAIDQDGQIVDAYFSQRRNAAAAHAFFERAIDETDVTPTRVTTDKAACYPPALRAVLPKVEHRTSKYLNNGLERDHGYLKQRYYPMRCFKQAHSAAVLARSHALIQNLRNGLAKLTMYIPAKLRLAVAWPQVTQAIERCSALLDARHHATGEPTVPTAHSGATIPLRLATSWRVAWGAVLEIKLHTDTLGHGEARLCLFPPYRLQAWAERRHIQGAKAQAGVVGAVPRHISEGRQRQRRCVAPSRPRCNGRDQASSQALVGVVWMHIKLMQMYRLREQMHNCKADGLVAGIDDYPGILAREVDGGRDRFIIGQVGIGRRAKVGGSSMLNAWECGQVIRARSADRIEFTQRGFVHLYAWSGTASFWARTT